jgi:hypothetical protein
MPKGKKKVTKGTKTTKADDGGFAKGQEADLDKLVDAGSGMEICPECDTAVVLSPDGERLCNCKASEVQENAVRDAVAYVRAAQQAQAAEQAQQAQAVPVAPQPSLPPPMMPNLPVAPVQEETPATPKDMMEKIPGAPSQQQIDLWKKSYGAVYLSPFEQSEMYVWRPIRYGELQKIKQNQHLAANEEKFQEYIVHHAVLWPNIDPTYMQITRAGMVPTLFSVIMNGSHFLPVEYALNLVQEL